MNWISFKDRKPEKYENLITRAPAWIKPDSFIDAHRIFDPSWEFNLLPHVVTHWWDGEYNFEKACEEWEKTKEHDR